MSVNFHESLKHYIEGFEDEPATIPSARIKLLYEFSDMTALESEGSLRLVFICTHNSRRSHIAQIWATTLAQWFGLEFIQTWSGGTEATAFHPNAVAAIRRAGFQVEKGAGENPVYQVHFSENRAPIACFSKVYDHPENPADDFVAIMTCSDADENCPVVPGASRRLSLTYEDPKISDGTGQESAVYDERVRQIGAELYFVMKRAGQLIAQAGKNR